MVIYTVVEIDYPYGLSNVEKINTWTFSSKEDAVKFAKTKQNKYTDQTSVACGYQHNTVNVFPSTLDGMTYTLE